MPNLVDIVNNTYGTWKVISKAESKNKHVYWNVECTKCGSKRVIGGTHLKNGTAAQCICNKSADEKILKRYALFAKMNFSYHQIKTGESSVINAAHITLITIIKG